MSLSDLYHLSDHEIDGLHKVFAASFYRDDLYCALFKDDQKRKQFLARFFKCYIQMIRPYCYFVADSKKCNSVMVVFDSKLENKKYMLRVIWMNIKVAMLIIRLHSWKGMRHMIACWDMFTSSWVKDFVHSEYLHLDLLCTKESEQGKGYGSKLLATIVEEANHHSCDITMETHHQDNLSLYESYGFVLMSTITHENYNLTQYNLLRRIERGV